MKKFYFFLLLLCSVLPGFAQEKEPVIYDEAFHLLEVWLDAQKDYENLPGITWSVVQDQDILWSGALGQANAEDNVEADPSTLFSICSISKLFTAVAIMKLYDEGKLRLDDRIGEILPWYDLEQQFPGSGPITIESLLTHSSGLPREANYPYWTGPDFPFPSQEEVKEGLEEQETLYPASTYFQYSNLGLTLLGEVVEEVSGMDYEAYIKENIIEPLRLSDTRSKLPEELYGEELAVGYGAIKRNGERDKIQFFQANGIKAAAGFSSNVLDLAEFASWQFRLLDTSATEILKPSTLRNMQNVHWVDPDWNTTWGLGFSVYQGPGGDTWVSHGGSCPGYRTVIQMNPSSKRAYVVMINAGGESPAKYARGIHSVLQKYEKEKDLSDSLSVDLEQYRGFYNAQPWSSELYVTPWKGKLAVLYLPTDNPANAFSLFKHVDGDTFIRIRDNGEPGETLTFERDENGNITRFERNGNYKVRLHPEYGQE